MRSILTACLGAAAAVLAATSWTPGAAAQQEIGGVELVRVWATGTPPQTRKRDLVVEDQVFKNEFVETVRDGALHLRFLDDTEFRLGSNSKAVLDSFVYDADTDSGEIAVTLSKGLFRYVSGKLKGDKITIKTPTATVGLRGTVVTIYVGPDGETIVDVDEGEAILRALNSDAVRSVTAATQKARAGRDGKVSAFDGDLPKDSGLEAEGGHEGKAGMKTTNSGKGGVDSDLAYGSASNGQSLTALGTTAVLDATSQLALGSPGDSVIPAGPPPGQVIVDPPVTPICDDCDDAVTKIPGAPGVDDIELPGVQVGLFDIPSPNLEGVIYEDVFAGAILSQGPNQGDVVDYALIGDFPDQSSFIDDIGFGGGLEGTIDLVPGVTESGQLAIPSESAIFAFGAPSDFTFEITGAVDGGASGIAGMVVMFDSSLGNPLFQNFDLQVGQTAVMAVTTTRDLGSVMSMVSDGSPGGVDSSR